MAVSSARKNVPAQLREESAIVSHLEASLSLLSVHERVYPHRQLPRKIYPVSVATSRRLIRRRRRSVESNRSADDFSLPHGRDFRPAVTDVDEDLLRVLTELRRGRLDGGGRS